MQQVIDHAYNGIWSDALVFPSLLVGIFFYNTPTVPANKVFKTHDTTALYK